MDRDIGAMEGNLGQSRAAAISRDDLTEAIRAFLRGFSIETTPHDVDKVRTFHDVLKAGTAIYVAHPPGIAFDRVTAMAARLQGLGYKAVPHLVARALESRAQLEAGLEALRAARVDRLLLVAGDQASPSGEFENALTLLRTGLLGQYGFRSVGVAGHPEGSRTVGLQVGRSLIDKARAAQRLNLDMYVVTQFGFDPRAVVDWAEQMRRQGVHLPVHVGIAGPAAVRQLVRYAMRCGIGASIRMLTTRAGTAANLVRTQTPDELITYLSRHRALNPSSRLVRAHFFAFGGVVNTANWLNSVISGRFTLNGRSTGFEVETGGN